MLDNVHFKIRGPQSQVLWEGAEWLSNEDVTWHKQVQRPSFRVSFFGAPEHEIQHHPTRGDDINLKTAETLRNLSGSSKKHNNNNKHAQEFWGVL